jgi:carbon starvation protein CstA
MTADSFTALGPLGPYLVAVLIGFLPSEIWRILAVFLARGVGDESQLLVWVRSVATALLAGIVAKLIVSPGGALAAVPLAGRLGSLALGLAGFYLMRRSILLGILLGEAALVAVAWAFAD